MKVISANTCDYINCNWSILFSPRPIKHVVDTKRFLLPRFIADNLRKTQENLILLTYKYRLTEG